MYDVSFKNSVAQVTLISTKLPKSLVKVAADTHSGNNKGGQQLQHAIKTNKSEHAQQQMQGIMRGFGLI
jgi:hypothetical protein